MKIRKLALKNYKVFDELILDFTDKTGATNNQIIIAGLNGSGKSTILELLKDILSGNALPNVNRNFEIDIEFDFSELKWFNAFLAALKKDSKIYDCIDHDKELLKQQIFRIKYAHADSPKTNVVLFKELMNIFRTLQTERKQKSIVVYRYSHDKVKSKKTKKVDDMVQEVSFGTHKTEMKDLILQPINQQIFKRRNLPPQEVIENEITSINKIFSNLTINSKFVDIDSEELIFQSSNKQRVKFDDLSSGEKLIYFMGFYLNKLNINSSMIIVDEPEDSLHPTWQRQIIRFYANIGENNQIILATHSPHVIASAPAENVYLLKLNNNRITVSQPNYTQGHSIPYVLSEIMETDYRDTLINETIEQYINLIKTGKQDSSEAKKLKVEIDKLDPNSEERIRIDMAERRNKLLRR